MKINNIFIETIISLPRIKVFAYFLDAQIGNKVFLIIEISFLQGFKLELTFNSVQNL